MAEQLEIEEQPDNIFEKAILPDEKTPDIAVELESTPDPRLEEQGLNEFESLLMADESRLIDAETPEYSEEEETYSQKYKRFYPISKFKTYQEVIDHEVDEFKKSNSDKVYKEEDLYLTKIHKKSHDDYNDRLRDKEEREWVEEQEKYNPKC